MKAEIIQKVYERIDGKYTTAGFHPLDMIYDGILDFEFYEDCCLKNPEWFEYNEWVYHHSWLKFVDPKIEQLINGNKNESTYKERVS